MSESYCWSASMIVPAPRWKGYLRIVAGGSLRPDNAARNWGKGRSRAAARRRRDRKMVVRFTSDER